MKSLYHAIIVIYMLTHPVSTAVQSQQFCVLTLDELK
jgi:hypothetical protein